MRNALSRMAAPLAAVLLAAGCGTEKEIFQPNQEPNTRISAGPPEATDTGYTVNLFWFGWDDDGFVDHYEIAWETPENWIGPIFNSDSTFLVRAADSCCVDALPDFDPSPNDSIYEQYHTFYVRAVDNAGVPDPTPAVRSFNAKTIAPYTQINFGPRDAGSWGTSVEFEWAGFDDDGVAVAFERALVNKRQFEWDNQGIFTTQKFLAWADTLTRVVIGPNSTYKDSMVWEYTTLDSVVYPELPLVDDQDQTQLYLFAVRAIDDAGAKERILTIPDNARRFEVRTLLNGPRIFLSTNVAGTFQQGEPPVARDVFAGAGIRFFWRGSPGQSGAPLAGFSYAVEDTALWSPFSLNSLEWPEQIEGDAEVLWFPDRGPHSFFVRAIDEGGFVSVLAADFQIFSGPRFCDPDDQTLLIVLDTDSQSMESNGLWPRSYPLIEKSLIAYWFEGYAYQVFETQGIEPVEVALLDCASSTVWFLSSSLNDSDAAILGAYHESPPNPLPSYVASGGNLFIVGLNPVQALRYFDRAEGGTTIQSLPVLFSTTLTDTTYLPHWAATIMGIDRITESVGNTNFSQPEFRLSTARAQVAGYPDLNFDPLTWPQGPSRRGFGFYDRGITPIPGAGTEVIYTFNDTQLALGVRHLTAPGVNGNTVLLTFHPYFVDRPAFRSLVQAVLTDFGEVMTTP